MLCIWYVSKVMLTSGMWLPLCKLCCHRKPWAGGMRSVAEEDARHTLKLTTACCMPCCGVLLLQILQRPAGVQPGALKAMQLNNDSYFMKVRLHRNHRADEAHLHCRVQLGYLVSAVHFCLGFGWQGFSSVLCCCAVTNPHDGWPLQELGAGTTYKNLRLASTCVDWAWVGAVHEYVRRKDGRPNTQHELQGYWLTHDASGGKGGTRYEQDAIILTKVCLWVAC